MSKTTDQIAEFAKSKLPVGQAHVDSFIASAVAEAVNANLLAACEKLYDFAMSGMAPPMYVLANARDAIDSAKRARGAKA